MHHINASKAAFFHADKNKINRTALVAFHIPFSHSSIHDMNSLFTEKKSHNWKEYFSYLWAFFAFYTWRDRYENAFLEFQMCFFMKKGIFEWVQTTFSSAFWILQKYFLFEWVCMETDWDLLEFVKLICGDFGEQIRSFHRSLLKIH